MYRKFTAVILLFFTSLVFAQPSAPTAQDIPDSYHDIIKKFSSKAQEIADQIPEEQRLLSQDILNRANIQRMKQCAKLATSKVYEERTAGLKCLNKLPKKESTK